ncbi:MAG: double-strand break repair helicase AddA [Alphaproteobacteria bacterium]|nr:double-strand break repair helicase AddA [Alphaproteobacteria bacterium]
MTAHDPVLAASDPARSAWVAANAGAGKTHTLANRVTRLLFADARPERILCLTFTKAAAAEMQRRLFGQLGRWSMLADAELARNIAAIGAEATDAASLRKARRLFAQALETPGGLKIQTIHAFCQNLLTRFPLEAGVAPSFRVLDERSAGDLIAMARARVLERAGRGDAQLASAVAHLVTQTSEGRFRQLLDAALGNDRRKLDRLFENRGGIELAARLRSAHGAHPGDTQRSIAEEFSRRIDAELAALKAIAAWLAGGLKTDRERAAELGAALAAGDPLLRFELLRDVFLTAGGERCKRLATNDLVRAQPELHERFEEFCAAYQAAEHRARAAAAADLAEATLSVAQAVRQIYGAEKAARAVLDYDDLIARSQALLQRAEAAQWVLFKLDGGIDHILIDEAQDTSPEQWAIVRALTDEFFAGAGRRPERRTVFAVGDEKQSIFSFQGADPKQFDINRLHFKARADAAELLFADERLETSRRSAPEILRFVDEVFADPTLRAGLTSGSEPIHHEPLRKDAKGSVELWPTLKPSSAPEPDIWRPVDVESEASPVVRLAHRIADAVAHWTDGRRQLPGHDRPIRPGDIMVLLPRREPFGGELIRRLKERGIAVAGADRIRLTEQIAVMDLIALGRFVLLAEDDLNLAALLRSPLIDLSEGDLFSLAHGRGGSLWQALSHRGGEFGVQLGFLEELRRRADFQPPFEFYAHVLGPLGMRAKLLARLGHEARDAIEEFLSAALAHEGANNPSLEGFLSWIERGAAEIKRDMESGRDEVRVMTVHGAKGLEADIVVLADTTSLPEAPGMKGHLLFAGDAALYPAADRAAPEAVQRAKAEALAEVMNEHRRLLYVALTRARNRLVVAGFESKKGIRSGSWYDLCRRAAERIAMPVERNGETSWILGDEAEDPAQPLLPLERAARTLPRWAEQPPLAEKERARPIRPSLEFADDEVVPPAGDRRLRRGLLVHALLAHLPQLAPQAREAAALRFLEARGAADAAALAQSVIRILSDERFAAAFAPGSRAEVDIVADLENLGRLSGRIDRLAAGDSDVLIVDFKTDRTPPENAAGIATGYLAQMALYRAAAAKIFPGRRIGCALLFTGIPRLMPLPDDLLDREMAAIAARAAAH